MLRTRLLLGFLAVLALLAAVGAHALWTTRQLGRTVADTITVSARGLLAAEQLKQAANRLGNGLRQLRNLESFAHREEFQRSRDALQRLLQTEAELTPAAAERARRLEDIEAAVARLAARAEQLDATGRPLETLQADEAALFAVLQAAEQLAGYDARLLREAETRTALLTERSTAIFSLGLGAAVLLTLALAWILGGLLLRPIRALTASAAALGEGRLEQDVPVTSRDELGELARTFNTMAASLRAYRDAMTARAQRAQRTMEATLTSAPDPLFVIARDGTQEVRNPAAEALAAGPEFAAGLPEELAVPLQQVLTTGQHYLPTDFSRVVTLRDRHYLPRILAIGDKLTDFRGAAIVLQDVTKLRLLDDAKSNLVGTVSHELKTPLTSLRLSVYLLLEQRIGGLSPAQRELVETARDEADRLLRILNDLLDLSRIESGVAAPRLEPVPVADLLEDMAREIRPILEAADQRLTVEVAAGLTTVPVDRDSLRHVFINLLTNASKYGPAGGEIRLGAAPTDDGFVRFAVRDDGPGIAPENQAKVFEKFYRVPGQSKKGAGLGLAICREIVVAHGGSIACSSAPGRGSEFSFLIPLRPTQNP